MSQIQLELIDFSLLVQYLDSQLSRLLKAKVPNPAEAVLTL
ncbi:MAG: hypothetical protein P8I55_05955 [Crocinitomix sp.]|nr:hypothetical protein [Crocinitomix sp.]